MAVRIGLINAGRGGILSVGASVLQLAEERKWDVVAVTEAHVLEGSSISLRNEIGASLDSYRVIFQPRPTTTSRRPPGGVMLFVRSAWCGNATITRCMSSADVLWVRLADLAGSEGMLELAVSYFPPTGCASLCDSALVDCCCRRSHVERGFDELAQRIDAISTQPNVTFVGCGDLNAHFANGRGNARGRLLVETLQGVGAELIESGPTRIYREQRPAVLDRFFVLSSQRGAFSDATVLGDEHRVSDHRPVEIMAYLPARQSRTLSPVPVLPLCAAPASQRVILAPAGDLRWACLSTIAERIYKAYQPRPRHSQEQLLAWQRSREAAVWEAGLEYTATQRGMVRVSVAYDGLKAAKKALQVAAETENQEEIDRCRQQITAIRTPLEAARRRARNLAQSRACDTIRRLMPHDPRAAHAAFERWFQMRRGHGGARNPYRIAGAKSGREGLHLWRHNLSGSVAVVPEPERTRRGELVRRRYEQLAQAARAPMADEASPCPFTEDEYNRALKRMNRGAASTGASTSAVLAAPPPLPILNKLWQSVEMPDGLFASRVHPIYKKKGLPDSLAGYRTVAVGSAEAKILLNMVLGRLETHAGVAESLPDSQYGFRPERSTLHASFLLQTALSWFAVRGRRPRLHSVKPKVGVILFTDIQNAFKSTRWDILFVRLHDIGVRGHTWRWLHEYYRHASLFFESEGVRTEPVHPAVGTPEGSPLSPLLFILVAAILSHTVAAIREKIGIPLEDGVELRILEFADDAAYVLADVNDLPILLHAIALCLDFLGLKLNVGPAKTAALLVLMPGISAPANLTSLCTLPDGRVIPVVQEYRHLGLCTLGNIGRTWKRQSAIAARLTRQVAGRLCLAGIRDMSRGIALIGLREHLWPRAEFACGLWGCANANSRLTEAALAAGARVCLGVNAAHQYALDVVVLRLTGTLLFEARCAHYRLRLLFSMLCMASDSLLRRALRMLRSLHRSAVDLPGCDDLIWWHHTELLLRRLAPHAALEEVPDLERLVRDCMVGSAAENRRVLSYLNREWVQRVCRRFNEELMEARLASHSSLDATRDLLLNRVPVFARHLNGRRDSCRVLALCGPRAWISHANYFTGVAAFASLAVDKARLANPRRACPFCHAPGLFTTPHIVAECRSPVIVHERAGILQPVFDSLSVFQRGCIPDPVLPDPHGVWVALATGVSHPLVRWSCDKRWEPWQHALYVQAAVYLNRVISASMVAFEELEATLDVSERE